MSASPRPNFLPWFLRRSVLGARSWTATLWCALTILIVTSLGLTGASIAHGLRNVGLQKLRDRPLARVVWAGDSIVSDLLTPARLEELETRIRRNPLTAKAVEKVCPFYDLEFKWGKEDGSDRWSIIAGRTVSANDLILKAIKPLLGSGETFTDAQDRGVIVTASLCEKLRLPATPQSLRLQLRDGGIVEVPIRGTLKPSEKLPLDHEFLIPTDYERELQTVVPNVRRSQIDTNPVPALWAPWEKLPPETQNALRQAFRAFKQHFPPEEVVKKGRVCWRLETKEVEGPTLSEWRLLLEGIANVMAAEKFPVEPAFTRIPVPPDVKPEAPNRPAFHRVAVFVKAQEVEHLPEVLDACADAGLPLDRQSRDAATQIRQLLEATTHWENLARWLVPIPSLFILLILFFLQLLRAREKTLEVGLLKALGVTSFRLHLLCLAEASIVWLLGLVAGLLFTLLALGLLNGIYGLDAEACFRLDNSPGWLLGAVCGGAWLACYCSFFAATWRARDKAPLISLTAVR